MDWEQNIEKETCIYTWVELETVFKLSPTPRSGPLGLQKVQKLSLIAETSWRVWLLVKHRNLKLSVQMSGLKICKAPARNFYISVCLSVGPSVRKKLLYQLKLHEGIDYEHNIENESCKYTRIDHEFVYNPVPSLKPQN